MTIYLCYKCHSTTDITLKMEVQEVHATSYLHEVQVCNSLIHLNKRCIKWDQFYLVHGQTNEIISCKIMICKLTQGYFTKGELTLRMRKRRGGVGSVRRNCCSTIKGSKIVESVRLLRLSIWTPMIALKISVYDISKMYKKDKVPTKTV